MKNNLRLFLYAATFGVAFIIWQKWQEANVPFYQQVDNSVIQQENTAQSLAILPAPASSLAALPANIVDSVGSQNTTSFVNVHTDVMNIVINLQGGTIERVELLDYSQTKQNKAPLDLLKTHNPGRFLLQSGLGSNSQAPDHYSKFSATQQQFSLGQGENILEVPLTWQNDQGIVVTKTYTFKRDSYDFELSQQVQNHGVDDWEGFAYQQLVFGEPVSRGGIGQVYTFTGGVTSTAEDSYNKIDLKEMRKLPISLQTSEGWVAMIQHYFLGAIVPKTEGIYNFYTNFNQGDHIIGVSSEKKLVVPNASAEFVATGYVGPKVQERLSQVAPKLDKTVDYGVLFMIAQPMFKVLSFIYDLIGNWGWAIIVMTLLIKLIFFAPSAWAYKSMAKMRRLQPEMARMKERYGEDRQAMSQAMMKLYRDEKVNPASGCVPMLLQIPFFIAFYWVLVESVELRHASWIGWVQDLSTRDPYFILPIINAALMFIQQKLNPPPPDPMQAKLMMILPLVFGFMFMWFPSGLVLYWTVSNAFSIVQQYIMNKRYGEPKVKKV
ncbi:membrane protein insertase YidC [Rappaport israeli]|uniref:membrane protein insertase YidC n=1 Tax=Rappaport israeli TaxID=1839807 RepID=UPI000930506F|nr:membrane protein insertase YidC [Rappaport israeli]